MTDSASTGADGPSRGMSMLSQLAPWLARFALGLIILVSVRWLWRAPRRANRIAILATATTILMIFLDVV
jgi:uncharacterized membrane protein